jgi:signal transduction histidine kinase
MKREQIKKNRLFSYSQLIIVLLSYSVIQLFIIGCRGGDSASSVGADNQQTQNKTIPIDTVFASPTDSLEYVVNNMELSPLERLKIYDKLSWDLGFEDLDKALYYGKLGLDLSNAIKNDSLNASMKFNMSDIYIKKEVFDTAKIYLDEALLYAKKVGNEELETSIYNEYGALFGAMGNNATAIEYYEKVIRLAEKNGGYRWMATALFNIAVKHYNDDNNEQAEKYLLKTLEIEQTKVEEPENHVLSSIYSLLSKVYRDTKQYEEAVESAQKALEFARLTQSKYYEREALANLSQAYAYHTQDYDKALELANQALSLAEETGNTFSIRVSLHAIGNIYLSAKNYSKSKIYTLRALELTTPENLTGRKMIIRMLLKNLILLRETDEALAAFEQFDSLSTALYNKNTQAALSELEVRYETEKKQREIEQQRDIIEKQNLQRQIFIGGIVLCVIILVLLWVLLRARNRRNRILAEKNEILAEMDATKNKFFSIISHDLKNPAIAQREAIQMLVNKVPQWDATTLLDYSHQMLHAADVQVELLNNLLSWAQVQSGRISCQPIPFDLAPTINSILELIGKIADAKGVTIQTEFPKQIIATVDANIIATVMRNLLANAVKFTPTGGQVTLAITPRDGTDGFTISIADTGIGMSNNELQELFHIDRRYSRQGTSGETGTGLGLIVCRELLEKHETTLHVESEEGKGSRFWFEI